jgi:FdhE protein
VREPQRSEPREVVELRRLKEDNPDLASAVDLQIELFQLQRRVQGRVALPSLPLDSEHLNSLLGSAPILKFDHLKIDWSDVRYLLRATASAMRTHDAIEDRDFARAEGLTREGTRLPDVIREWYQTSRGGSASLEGEAAGLEALLLQTMRPILTRAADAIMARTDLSSWKVGTCPLCGGEPDLAVITPAADRMLICGRCSARWRFHQFTCPFCMNEDRSRITSFASRDGRYRLYACELCERYIKAYDARNATRPVMPIVDSVATIPLDAAAMQKGYK